MTYQELPTKAHEYIFLLAKSERYYYDQDIIREPNARIWDETNIGENNLSVTGAAKGVILGRRDMPHCGLANTMPNKNGRNKRTVWEVVTTPYKEAHFATFPPKLIEPCILAGCPPGGVVLDPFFGSGTVGEVAIETGRNWLGIELNPQYIELAKRRIAGAQPALIAPCGIKE